MKSVFTRKFLALCMLGVVGVVGKVTAQQVLYNNASIFIQPGTNVYVQGGVTNAGTGTITNSGRITVTGDWINNASNAVFISGANGKVVMNGNAQTISGSTTNFEVLQLRNASVKTVSVNTVVEDTLDLVDCEMAVGTNTVSLQATGIFSLAATTGFVSNGIGGGLARNTASVLPYVFPVGSSIGTLRVRPVGISPLSSSPNTFKVGFHNNNPTQDNYPASNTSSPICYVNNDWYHTIERTSGASGASVSISFDPTPGADTTFTNMAIWNGATWTDMGPVNVVNNPPQLSVMINPSVTNFTNIQYALATQNTPNTISAQGPTTFCAGGSVVLQADQVQTSYQWLDSQGNPIPGETNSTYTATQAGTYSLQVINGLCNVVSGNTITVTVNPLPNATFTAPQGLVCQTDNPYTLVPNTPGGSFSGTGITNPSAGTFDPGVAGPGTWNIVYNVTDGNGCSNLDSASITVTASQVVSIQNPGILCLNGGPQNLSGTPGGGTWSGTGITNPSAGTFDPSVSGVGTFTVTYNVNQGGCPGTATDQIVVNPVPNSSFTSANQVCVNGTPITLTPNTPGGAFTGNGVTNPNGTFDPAVAGVGTHAVTYTLTINGCTSTTTNNIQVVPTPTVTVNSVAPVCANASPFNLTASPAGGSWTGTGITNSSLGTFNPQVSGPGSFPVSYTVTQNGCTGTGSTTVFVNPMPDASFTAPGNTLCIGGNPVTLTPTTPGGTFSGSPNVTPNGVFTPSTAGQFQVTYTVTQNGCTSTTTQNVNVDPVPVASFTASTPPNPSVQFNNTSTGGTSYQWDFGDGQSSTQQSPSHVYTGSQQYTATLVVVNACGSDTATQTFTISWTGTNPIDDSEPFVSVYPNPFKESTNLEITLPGNDQVDIIVYDMLGQKVFEVSDINMMAGTTMYPLDQVFIGMPSASYFVHVRMSDGFTSIHKLIRM